MAPHVCLGTLLSFVHLLRLVKVQLFSLFRINLWSLLLNLSRIDDELEWIGVLILFHQLEICEALGTFKSLAVGEFWFDRLDQARRHLVLPVRGKTLRCFSDLRVRETQVVSQQVGAIRLAGMSQPIQIRLPVTGVLIVESVYHMLAQEIISLIGIRLIGQKIRRNEVCFVNRSALVAAAN